MRQLETLTINHLRKAQACPVQRNLFRAVFPRGFVPNRENFLRAADVGLDVSWAVDHFLNSRTAGRIFDKVHLRRWSGPYRTGTLESFQHSTAIVWWETIQEQLNRRR